MPSKSRAAGHRDSDPPERKVLLTIEDELKTRMRTTIEHTRGRTGITTQQAFIRVAIEDLCAKLEKEYNRGKRFPKPPVI